MNYLLQFLVSGGIVVGAVYLSNTIDQKWAGLIVALPLSTLLAYIFLSMGDSGENHQQYLLSALLFAVPALIFIGSLYFFSDKTNFVVNILIGVAVFTPFALLANKIIG